MPCATCLTSGVIVLSKRTIRYILDYMKRLLLIVLLSITLLPLAVTGRDRVPPSMKTPTPLTEEEKQFKAEENRYSEGLKADIGENYALAIEIWRPLALSGHAKAQWQMGNMYFSGHGVPQDKQSAAKWYSLCASSLPFCRTSLLFTQPKCYGEGEKRRCF